MPYTSAATSKIVPMRRQPKGYQPRLPALGGRAGSPHGRGERAAELAVAGGLHAEEGLDVGPGRDGAERVGVVEAGAGCLVGAGSGQIGLELLGSLARPRTHAGAPPEGSRTDQGPLPRVGKGASGPMHRIRHGT